MTSRTAAGLPPVIQGGMGVGVSGWRLANAVSRLGQLGVVSGTALDSVLARRLQDGDEGGHVRRALAAFPFPDVAGRVLARYYRPAGRGGRPYLPLPRIALRRHGFGDQLAVLANFVEVWLAKEGHDGPVGINFLEKIQMATPAAAYGAMLAGVDVVLMGAGVPREIPRLLDVLAAHAPGTVHVDIPGADPAPVTFDPALLDAATGRPPLRRPVFLAIVSAPVLAQYLVRDAGTRPDGFVVEGPRAGGHNAPPRGRLTLDDSGQPVFGPRDDADPSAFVRIGLPFWLAGGYGEPERVAEALAAGAAGVQVGTLFALSDESGLEPSLRHRTLDQLHAGTLQVRTEAGASPTGFPFKVAQVPGTLAEPQRYAQRPRLCDLGYLRTPYARAGGAVGYRCPAEPVQDYVRKGGEARDAEGAACLCNALTADVGLGQERASGYREEPLVTLGADLDGARRLVARHGAAGWSAADAVDWLLGTAAGPKAPVTPPGRSAGTGPRSTRRAS